MYEKYKWIYTFFKELDKISPKLGNEVRFSGYDASYYYDPSMTPAEAAQIKAKEYAV